MIDTAACVNDVVYRLGFGSLSDLTANAPWLNATELYHWADDAVKRLTYASGLFLQHDASITVAVGTAVYNLPAAHVYSVALWNDTRQLRITAVNSLWALDSRWTLAVGPPTRCSFDAAAVGTVTLYPIPDRPGTLHQVCSMSPADVTAGAATVAMPAVLQDYLSYAMLAGARGKESPAAMLDMAGHYRERMRLYEQVIQHLWGKGI